MKSEKKFCSLEHLDSSVVAVRKDREVVTICDIKESGAWRSTPFAICFHRTRCGNVVRGASKQGRGTDEYRSDESFCCDASLLF